MHLTFINLYGKRIPIAISNCQQITLYNILAMKQLSLDWTASRTENLDGQKKTESKRCVTLYDQKKQSLWNADCVWTNGANTLPINGLKNRPKQISEHRSDSTMNTITHEKPNTHIYINKLSWSRQVLWILQNIGDLFWLKSKKSVKLYIFDCGCLSNEERKKWAYQMA